MTRFILGFMYLLALGVIPMVGCGETGGAMGQAFQCTEQGIPDAINLGGGPHTFDCDGLTTAVTEATIEIDNDVILDGEGNLTVNGNEDHRVFSVSEGVTVDLDGECDGSVAIGVIPEAMGEVDEDQRGEPRPAGAESKRDVGSFEVQEGLL